ncbi:MAG: sigma-70 family RNA polymerase sigma factor [Candidatus Omnitrophota bacterium]|nr:MAG: sigma-70 family RNA polymerase sigma factor [Candidatus Omnitrophota bacterium]
MQRSTDIDVVKLYLKDIDKAPLLSAEEEIRLARRIKKGDTRARRKMVQCNLRLVVNIAKKYSRYGVPLLDLIEEGNLGLMKAVKKYDPRMGYRFSTYVSWWIKQAILRALSEQGKTIRVPVYMSETINRYKRAIEQLKHKLHRRPRLGEIAKKLKVSTGKIKEIKQAMDTEPASLETPIGENGTGRLLDLVEDVTAESPFESITKLLQQERVREVLDTLKPRYKRVLVLRFGLDGKGQYTLEEIGERLKISKERVRQIEDSATNQLRDMLVAKEKGKKVKK